jgi:trk system potassium uptake protein TrkA
MHARVSSLRPGQGSSGGDVVVAADRDDEDKPRDLVAREAGIRRAARRRTCHHPENEWLFNDNWGVDISVSTPHLITALVEEAVSVGRLVRILQFEGGNVRWSRSPGRRRAGRRPRDQGPRHPARRDVVAVVRGEHVVMPRGDTIFEAGDEVLAMVTGDSEADVRNLLTGK